MALLVPDVGKPKLLDLAATPGAGTFQMHLFQNDIVPDHATLVTDLDEADFDGYGPKSLLGRTDALTLDVSRRAVTKWTAINWVLTLDAVTPNQIYGYWVVDPGSGAMVWIERFGSGVVPMVSAGDSLTIVPQLTLKSEFNN